MAGGLDEAAGCVKKARPTTVECTKITLLKVRKEIGSKAKLCGEVT
jgi:hypothetical protein